MSGVDVPSARTELATLLHDLSHFQNEFQAAESELSKLRDAAVPDTQHKRDLMDEEIKQVLIHLSLLSRRCIALESRRAELLEEIGSEEAVEENMGKKGLRSVVRDVFKGTFRGRE